MREEKKTWQRWGETIIKIWAGEPQLMRRWSQWATEMIQAIENEDKAAWNKGIDEVDQKQWTQGGIWKIKMRPGIAEKKIIEVMEVLIRENECEKLREFCSKPAIIRAGGVQFNAERIERVWIRELESQRERGLMIPEDWVKKWINTLYGHSEIPSLEGGSYEWRDWRFYSRVIMMEIFEGRVDRGLKWLGWYPQVCDFEKLFRLTLGHATFLKETKKRDRIYSHIMAAIQKVEEKTTEKILTLEILEEWKERNPHLADLLQGSKEALIAKEEAKELNRAIAVSEEGHQKDQKEAAKKSGIGVQKSRSLKRL